MKVINNNFFENVANVYNKSEIKNILTIFLVILIITLLDIFAFALIVPVFNFIFLDKIPNISSFINLENYNFNLGGLSKIFILLFFLLVFFFKNIIVIGFNLFYLDIFKKINLRITKDLFYLFINQDYTFFLKNNSENSLQKLQTDCNSTNFSLQSFTNLSTEIIFLFGLSILLIFTNFKIFIFVFITFFITFFLYLKIFNKRFKKWGVDHRNSASNSQQIILDGINGLKDIIVYDLKKNFEKKYNMSMEIYNHTNNRLIFLNNIQRYWLEIIGFFVMILAMMYFIIGNYNVNTLVPIFGLYTLAVLRFISSINRIIVNFQVLKFNYPSYKALLETIKYLKKANSIKAKEIFFLTHSIQLKNVNFGYENESNKILNNTNLKIYKGESICIFGKNGSGKTTFLNLISGLLNPKSGSIVIDNKYNILNNRDSWIKSLSYVQQNIFLLDTSIKNNITLSDNDKIDYYKYDNLLKVLDLDNYFKELPNKLDTQVGFNGTNLSGGQKQMISLARSLYKDSELVIFDEPTSALDEVKSKLFRNIILSMRGKKTIIVVTHEKNLFEKCFDKTFEINSGNLVLQEK
jgi:ABC-type multidrug transport system fused ATPase/permease subunit